MYRSSARIFAMLIMCAMPAALHAQTYHLGRAATPAEIAGWDIDVRSDGQGLPKGTGTAVLGKSLYAQKCAVCHGESGEGKPADRLVGGKGTLNTDKPVMTVGSYWAYATTVFDYINRAMPFTEPQSLTPDEVYSITAYLLHLNGIIAEKDVLDQTTLPKVQMPNRNGFISDPRPDIRNAPCERGCK